ncbi:MAG: ABC transporter permease [Pseudomonadota bacterium]
MSESAAIDVGPVRGQSPGHEARARFAHNRAAMIGLVLLALMALLALFGPLCWLHTADTLYSDRIAWAPALKDWHVLGTDSEGRDVAARVLIGVRFSLLILLAATFVMLAIGVVWGAIAGAVGGAIDATMMRVVDALCAIPFVLLVVLLLAVVSRSDPTQNMLLIILALGATNWFKIARAIRDEAALLRHASFVDAARTGGASSAQIFFRHIAPNLSGQVIVQAVLAAPLALTLESVLSFLGFGAQAPFASLGQLIAAGVTETETAPWMMLSAVAALLVTLLALNLVGDGVRAASERRVGG